MTYRLPNSRKSNFATEPRKVYEKGISLSKMAMEAVEARLKRDPQLPKYDILINPASTS
jgi:hypothetical protein